ncbi:MAG TPA: ABC transporter permease [Rhodanobacteraceae bacterium]
MSTIPSDPVWKCEDDARIALSGSWSLLVDRRRRERLFAQFGRLDATHDYCWDLRAVDALDSTGALLLWKVWNARLPERLDCSDDQRALFKWLANTAPLGESPERASTGWLHRLGAGVRAVLEEAAGIFILTGQLALDVGYCLSHPRVTPWREISANVHRIGASAMLLLGCIGFLIGAVMTIQMGLVLQPFGASGMVINMMATAVPRELGAVVVGLLMAGRTGSAMTASIGAMRITEEYDALQALGSSPSMRLALPRVIGAAISMPLLVVWTNIAVTIGAALAAQGELGINFGLFLTQMLQQVQTVNVWIGLGKGVLFGLVISVVGCHFGMSSSPDAESMSHHTTLSVVTSLTAVLLLDASLGAMLTNVGLM